MEVRVRVVQSSPFACLVPLVLYIATNQKNISIPISDLTYLYLLSILPLSIVLPLILSCPATITVVSLSSVITH